MYQIRKQFRFEGAHTLTTAYSEECKNIHGHSYRVEFFFRAKELNPDGMVIDFKKISEVIRYLIDFWDHTLVVDSNDTRENLREVANFSVPFNPTAENIARHFYNQIHVLCPELYKVRLHETETGYVEYWEE